MIYVDCTFMPVEVLSPLHTSLMNVQQLFVSNMVPSFSRGELFAIKSYLLPILRQLSPYSYITGIFSQIYPEWLGVRIPLYGKRIKQAAELRTALSQRMWGPAKWITGAT